MCSGLLAPSCTSMEVAHGVSSSGLSRSVQGLGGLGEGGILGVVFGGWDHGWATGGVVGRAWIESYAEPKPLSGLKQDCPCFSVNMAILLLGPILVLDTALARAACWSQHKLRLHCPTRNALKKLSIVRSYFYKKPKKL